MKVAMKWSKMDRVGARICQNDDIGLNIDFPLSKYAKIWRKIANMSKIDPKIFIFFHIFSKHFSYFPIKMGPGGPWGRSWEAQVKPTIALRIPYATEGARTAQNPAQHAEMTKIRSRFSHVPKSENFR